MKTTIQLILTHLDTETWILKDIPVHYLPAEKKGLDCTLVTYLLIQ